MARSLDQIYRDQDRLNNATVLIESKLADLYRQYLKVLGEAVRHQLILATYHLCTQTYPEAFLKLSMGQREKLQQGIRQLGHQGKTHIEALNRLDNVTATLNLLLQTQTQLGGFFATQRNQVQDNAEPEATAADTAAGPVDLFSLALDAPSIDDHSEEPAKEAIPPSLLELSSSVSKSFDSDALVPMPIGAEAQGDGETPEPTTLPQSDSITVGEPGVSSAETNPSAAAPSPLQLAKRHVLLERQIRSILHSLSNMTNHALKKAGILPDLPEAVLTAATEAEADEQAPNIPNLLNVIVEIGRDRPDDAGDEDALEDDPLETELEESERTMTHLVAMNLRLADIEFTDTRTALWRSKIQEILGQLKKLSRHYQKLQQEKAQAEAEAAWRTTWFEEQPSDPS